MRKLTDSELLAVSGGVIGTFTGGALGSTAVKVGKGAVDLYNFQQKLKARDSLPPEPTTTVA